MKKYLVLGFAVLTAWVSNAQNDARFYNEDGEVYYYFEKNINVHPAIIEGYKNADAWQDFKAKYGSLMVYFDEVSGMPHRVFGKPMSVPSGANNIERAKNFMQTELADWEIPVDDLVVTADRASEKFQFANFRQTYKGMEILFSNATVRFNMKNEVVLFGMDVFPDVNLEMQPTITANSAEAKASFGLVNRVITKSTASHLKILPVPIKSELETENWVYDYKLVYEVEIEGERADGLPVRMYTLVDAHTGEVWYRTNQIHTCLDHASDGGEVEMNGDFDMPGVAEMPMPMPPTAVDYYVHGTITDNPLRPTYVAGLQNLEVKESSNTFYTDGNGHLLETINTPVSGTFSLKGKWADVRRGGASTPTITKSISATVDTVDYDAQSPTTEVSAYYHVNIVHDYMKSIVQPGFTAMDNPLTTNVDLTSGTCNAFYNGTSINFYRAGGGCDASALFNDVVYHEYGHGINAQYYNYLGTTFANGALGEGYADIWALLITNYPIVAEEFRGPGTDIRRYDINPKIYPQDIVGEVHADGEIIAGAWWDFFLNTSSNQTLVESLYAETLLATAMAPSGQEGKLYRDILIDLLLADDTDADFTNGTPNDVAIIDGFKAHGITLITDIVINHTDGQLYPTGQPVKIQLTSIMDFPNYRGDFYFYYKTDPAAAFDSVAVTYVSGNDFEVNLPTYADGTILYYYFRVWDVFGSTALVEPNDAHLATDANIPMQGIVGVYIVDLQDFDTNFDTWVIDPFGTDDATSGAFDLDAIVGSWLDAPHTAANNVQADEDFTPNNNGDFCVYTGNAGAFDQAGANDIDNGRNTIRTPQFDLSSYTDPIISYRRWFSNEMGANPGNDPFRVFISDDLINWVRVENTYVPDRAWRMNTIRVKDYVGLTSKVAMYFEASDSIDVAVGDNNGQSLVEASLDDLTIYEVGENNIGLNNMSTGQFKIYPNPAQEKVFVELADLSSKIISIRLLSTDGRAIKVLEEVNNIAVADVSQLSQGLYMIEVKTEAGVGLEKFIVY